MVGVPGRSKGCNTCRKRKKGCDLQRPVCGQCLKAGIECAGYERKRIFVNVTSKNPKPKNTALALVAPPTIQAPLFSHSAYEEKILDLFWETYMPDAPAFTPGTPIVRYSHSDWAATVQDLYRTDAALRQSLLAISLGTIGRRDKHAWMIDEGLKFYCQALGELNTALRHPTRWSTLRLALGPKPDIELPERTNPRVFCTKIANIVDVFFHPNAGTFGISSAPLPIGMALVYLNSTEEGFNSEDKRKLVSFFGMRANNGIGIGKFLISTQSDGIVPRGAVQYPKCDAIKDKAKRWMGAVG
ncbi:hypothetical protein K4K59_008854 [Colletotrichum sp. SAR11_240]|nr:hypothetical protein K4K59_008854 [Colletotrichum sp. SAR11_240]